MVVVTAAVTIAIALFSVPVVVSPAPAIVTAARRTAPLCAVIAGLALCALCTVVVVRRTTALGWPALFHLPVLSRIARWRLAELARSIPAGDVA